MDGLLSGKTAIVTGGASGIGRAISHTFATQGASVVVADLQATPREGGDPIHDVIANETDAEATFVECDVTNENQLVDAIEAAEALGGLDIMVNNAGIVGPTAPIQEIDIEEFRQLLAVNVEGVFTGSQLAAAAMLESDTDGGSIINMSSVAGLCGYANITPYNIAKGGVRLFTYGLAAELGPHDIRVNAIHPGVIETEMTKTDFPVIGGEDEASALEAIPLRRFGKPEDVANVATFLASEMAAHVTAESIIVDGGEYRTA